MGTGIVLHLQKLPNMMKTIRKTQEISNMLGTLSGEINKAALHGEECQNVSKDSKHVAGYSNWCKTFKMLEKRIQK